MSEIKFEKKTVIAEIRNPLKGFEITTEEIEIRTDPLLNYHVRISKPKGLDKIPEENPLSDFVKNSKPCFFCEGRVEKQTPMMPEHIYAPGRIQVGDALLFPNLSGFGKFSGVCIFSKEHYTPLDKFTKSQIFNVLKACQIYFQSCAASGNDKLYPSVNFNYLLPAGSSILHPHIQPFLDPVPTNFHQDLITASENYMLGKDSSYWDQLKILERKSARFLFEGESSFWFTPFAPTGFNEINGIIGSGQSFSDLSDDVLEELSDGIIKIFLFYHTINHNSLNMTIFSPPMNSQQNSSFSCLLKIASRPVFMQHYRNDVTFFEKFHNETIIDKYPEQVALEFSNFLSNY